VNGRFSSLGLAIRIHIAVKVNRYRCVISDSEQFSDILEFLAQSCNAFDKGSSYPLVRRLVVLVMKFAGICLQIVEFESVRRVVVDELVSFRPYPYMRPNNMDGCTHRTGLQELPLA
jgi:hypothetical protein